MAKSFKERLVGALRWSERYTKTDMVYLAHGGFWLMLGYAAQMISGLILAVALANLLPKENYGTYQFIISFSTILGGFTLTGMGTALTRAVAMGSQGALPYAFRKQLLWSTGIAVASGSVALYYFFNQNYELGVAFLIAGACSPFLSGFSLYRPYLEGKQLFRESTLLGAWRRPLPIIAVGTALFFTEDPMVLVLTYFIAQTLSMGLLYKLIIQRYPEPSREDPELLRYSKHLSVMGMASLVANNLDNVIVFHFLGAAPVAAYTLAQLPSTHLHKMFGLVGKLIFPKFARQEFEALKESIAHKVFLFFLATAGTAAAYWVAAPYIFALLFPGYPEAVLLSQVLILSLLFKSFMLYGQAFSAHALRGTQYFVQISSGALKLCLLVVLLPLYGLWGAVWAVLAMSAYWAAALMVLFYTRKI